MLTVDLPAVRTALEVHGGFTLDPRTGRMLTPGEDRGYVIALPGTEQLLGHEVTEEGFRAAFDAATAEMTDDQREVVFVGGWYSSERGYMIELSQVLDIDRDSAEVIGRAFDQDAIFDLTRGEEIPLRVPAEV